MEKIIRLKEEKLKNEEMKNVDDFVKGEISNTDYHIKMIEIQAKKEILAEIKKDLNYTDIDFIKDFNKITIKRACEIANVNYNNLLSGKTSKENELKVRNTIEIMYKNLG